MNGIHVWSLGLILLLSSISCFAQNPVVCPWLSTGSAAEALGGVVELDVHIESSSQGMCRFIHGSGTEQKSIEITIGKVDTHACRAGSNKMIGLGNEAVECDLTSAGNLVLNLIAGRVRDAYFVVAIRNPRGTSADSPGTVGHGDPDRAPILERVAEQVVGNLY
ncbi:MAG TPA: hypothetical protein VGI45_13360 [Terracidiphilus sp.]|jgi:hypothetical protein